MTHLIVVVLPLKIISEANSRDYWRKSAARKKLHRETARALLQRYARPMHSGPIAITLTRRGPRRLDDDNLASGFKAVRDGVADWMGIDDGSSRLTWVYLQRPWIKGAGYAAEVQVRWSA